MKKIILSIACIIGLAALSIAQDGDRSKNREESRKKLEASKVAYITSYLDLSAAESADFWPVYNEYKKAHKELKGAKGDRKKVSDMTDAEATTKLDQYISMSTEQAALKAKYLKKFRLILSDKKVLMLNRAESEFKKQVVKRYADGRRGDRQGGSRGDQKK